MAQFCTTCGNQIADGSRFCAKCGTLQTPGAAPPAAPAPATAAAAPAPVAVAAAAPAKSSPVLKIVLIVVGLFFLMGAVAIVGVVYTAYRVKNRVETAARERGVDLGALTSSHEISGRLPDPCSLISTSEASDILGVKVVSSERSGRTCNYKTETLTAEEQQEKISNAMKELDANKGAENEKDPTKALEGLTKAFGGAIAAGQGGFSIELNPDGKVAINAMRLAMNMAGGKGMSKRIDGLGDDAELGPLGSMLVFTKSGIGVQVDGRMITGQEKLIAMAQRIASRI